MRRTLRDMLAEAAAEVPAVGPSEVERRQWAGGLLVDVREAPELEAGMVPGALHVPRGMLEFCADPDSDFYLADFRFERPITLYCGIGERSALAGLTLLRMGYRDVANMPSFDSWLLAGRPLAPPPRDP